MNDPNADGYIAGKIWLFSSLILAGGLAVTSVFCHGDFLGGIAVFFIGTIVSIVLAFPAFIILAIAMHLIENSERNTRTKFQHLFITCFIISLCYGLFIGYSFCEKKDQEFYWIIIATTFILFICASLSILFMVKSITIFFNDSSNQINTIDL